MYPTASNKMRKEGFSEYGKVKISENTYKCKWVEELLFVPLT